MSLVHNNKYLKYSLCNKWVLSLYRKWSMGVSQICVDKIFLHTIVSTVHKFKRDYWHTEPEPGHIRDELKGTEIRVPVKNLHGLVLTLCFVLLALALSALDAAPNSEQIMALNSKANHDSLLQFPQVLIGTWVADEPDYIEPNGWEDWYREIYIYVNEVGDICIEYGCLVFSIVRSVEMVDDCYKIGVYTELDESTYYYLKLKGKRLFVKALRILVNEPDTFKEYYRV